MHNLGTVFKFEVSRTLKKKTFWIVAAAFPVIIAAVLAIVYFSSKTTDELAQQAQNREFSIVYTDDSKLIAPSLFDQLKAKPADSKTAGMQQVRSGQAEAYFYYPADLTKNPVEIYAQDVGLFDNNRYEAVAKLVLRTSAQSQADPQIAAVLRDSVDTSATIYKDGQPYDGFKQLVAPGFFLVLFYLLIAMFSNQMLTSTTEEKENRVIEMLLTTVQARTLIIGKILSLMILALIQIGLIIAPSLLLYLLLREPLGLPTIDASGIPFDWGRITVAATIFGLGFMLYTGILVAIGAAVPTAKEANNFFGVVMVFLFGPLYAASLFISAPESSLVQFLSYFPLTAPIPLLLRNAVGNISYPEVLVGIAILGVSAAIALTLAIRIFRYGVIAYDSRISLGRLFAIGRHK